MEMLMINDFLLKNSVVIQMKGMDRYRLESISPGQVAWEARPSLCALDTPCGIGTGHHILLQIWMNVISIIIGFTWTLYP